MAVAAVVELEFEADPVHAFPGKMVDEDCKSHSTNPDDEDDTNQSEMAIHSIVLFNIES